MSSEEVLEQFLKDGVVFNVTGVDLKLDAPKGYFTPDKLAVVRSHKSEILSLVARRRTSKIAFVWKVEVDGKRITVIDPHHESVEAMRKAQNDRFGESRVGAIHLQNN